MKQKHRKKGVRPFPVKASSVGAAASAARSSPLLKGVSLLAASLLPGMAHAAMCNSTGPGDTLVTDSQGCYEWTQGDFEVTNSGMISGDHVGVAFLPAWISRPAPGRSAWRAATATSTP